MQIVVQPPLFVGGFPSGGTDLLKTVLNAHPDINICGEMPFLHLLPSRGYTYQTTFNDIKELEDFLDLLRRIDYYRNLKNLDYIFESEISSAGQIDLTTVLRWVSNPSQSIIWGNKTPQNTEHLPELLALAPDAHVLIITRDVRDVCLSWRKKWGKNIYLCSQKWQTRMRFAWDYAQSLKPDRILFVRFEDLLQEPETVTRSITNYLGLPWSHRMLEHHKYTSEVMDGKINYGKAIKPGNTKKWQMGLKPREIRIVEEIAFDTMQVFGYEPEYAQKHVPLHHLLRFVGRLHDAYSLLFVGNRESESNTFGMRLRTVAHVFRQGRYRRTASL